MVRATLIMIALVASNSAATSAQVIAREMRQTGVTLETGSDTATAVALSGAFRFASQRTLPAVVFIAIEQLAPGSNGGDPQDQFRDFFGVPRGEGPRVGTGSGFIVDAEGYILTNTHVVADAARLTVRMHDGREYSARIIGSDISTDIALIKIDARKGEKFPAATLGNSDDLRVGDWVLALGNPLGLDFTVTAGIVSAKGRQISPSELQGFIQTDAAINPGNSGGPLIDLFGRVVGINSAIFGTNRFVGYGFAVPSNLVRRVAADLREHGYLRRPLLGVQVHGVRAVDAEAYKLSEVRGAFVEAVTPGEPAAVAGLRPGDVILGLNGDPLRDDTHLITTLAEARPGQEVTLSVVRNGRTQDLKVKLGEFQRPPEPKKPDDQPLEQSHQTLGFTVRELTSADVERNRYTGDGGVVIASVIQHSAASANQLRQGVIVLTINGTHVRTPDEVDEVIGRIKPGSAVAVSVYDSDLGTERMLTFRARQ